MAKNKVNWAKVQKIGDKYLAEGYCESDLTVKPTTFLDETSNYEYPLMTGSKILESDSGKVFFYGETSGWDYMFTFKEEEA